MSEPMNDMREEIELDKYRFEAFTGGGIRHDVVLLSHHEEVIEQSEYWRIAHSELSILFHETDKELKSSLAANRELEDQLDRAHEASACECSREEACALLVRAEKAESSNREQKSEIERLKEQLNAANSACEEGSEIVGELASAGEKWIDVKQELPAESVRVLAFSPARPQWAQNERYFVTQMRHYSGKVSMFWFYGDINRWATHWQPLPAPPTLPREEKS
jgi:hypothetical protein